MTPAIWLLLGLVGGGSLGMLAGFAIAMTGHTQTYRTGYDDGWAAALEDEVSQPG